MNVPNARNVERLRRELKNVLAILERRKPWQPLSTPCALCAHAHQILCVLRATTTDTGHAGELESCEVRLRDARMKDFD